MEHDFFISYSNKDYKEVNDIVKIIESYEAKCWFQTKDSKQQYAQAIKNGIHTSSTFLVFISEFSAKSTAVLNEIDCAVKWYDKNRNYKILPIVLNSTDIENSENDQINYYLGRFNMIFERDSQSYEELVLKIFDQTDFKTEIIDNLSDNLFYTISGRQVNIEDIRQGSFLDSLVYEKIYIADFELCKEWFKVNPDIYVMVKEKTTNNVIAYINVAPITEECYKKFTDDNFIDTEMSAEMLLSYDMPSPYNVYISSIVIHPDYQNTEVFMILFNAVIDKFINLSKCEIYIQKILADAVTKSGEKFCKLFGMTKIKDSNHNSALYEISLIPPKFKILSKKTKELYDFCLKKYKECPYLFQEE